MDLTMRKNLLQWIHPRSKHTFGLSIHPKIHPIIHPRSKHFYRQWIHPRSKHTFGLTRCTSKVSGRRRQRSTIRHNVYIYIYICRHSIEIVIVIVMLVQSRSSQPRGVPPSLFSEVAGACAVSPNSNDNPEAAGACVVSPLKDPGSVNSPDKTPNPRGDSEKTGR